MPIDPDLSAFVREALRAGRAERGIRDELSEAGWTGPEIDAALAGWMPREGGAPVPRPVRSRAAREALFYALLFVVFGMVAGNTLSLLLGQVDLRIPEPGDAREVRGPGGLRWSMASLIVFLPVLWGLDRADRRATRSDPSRRHGPVRRWLSAIALLLAALALLGDALYLIHSWLGGQITLRFAVKSAIVAVMAGVVLAYFREARNPAVGALPVPAIWPLTGLAIMSLGLSFWTVGGPAQGRMETRDTWRLGDLRRLAQDVAVCEAIAGDVLPERLDPMICAQAPARLTGYAGSVRYERLSPARFRLCTELEAPDRALGGDLEITGSTACLSRERR